MAKKKTTAARTATKKVAKKSTKKPVKKKTTKSKPAGKSAAKKSPTKKKTTASPAGKSPARKKAAASPTKKSVTKKKTTASAVKKKTTKKTTKKTSAGSAAKAPVAAPAKTDEQLLEEAMDRDWTVAQLKRVKTGLTKKDLAYFLQLLLEKRAEIIGNVQGMEDARNASLGDIAHMPLHMADVGSDNFEQEFTLGLMESERQMLREIEEAIVRMREGYYGVCVDSGRPINRDRLEAKPWAKYCIEVARIREKRGW